MKKSFLAICFAVLSLGSFADEKVYEAKAEARGYNEDGVPIVLTVKATKFAQQYISKVRENIDVNN